MAVAVDPHATFWQLAASVGAFSADRELSYQRLVPQWDSSFPDATSLEREAALARLARVLRLG
ncbi:MAG: hypothetical protein ABIX37_10775 [Gammaproteobacteria bacterium]